MKHEAPQFLEAQVDADLLSRLMINLLSNAVKYSVTHKTVLASLSLEDKGFKLCIKDEGYGMSKAQLKTLFQKYKRGPDTQVTGTGLGLYLVKLIVDAHQAEIQVNSEPGQGTSFELWFPLD